MNDFVPAGCVYRGRDRHGWDIHSYAGWMIWSAPSCRGGYVARRIGSSEADILADRDFRNATDLLFHAVGQIDHWTCSRDIDDVLDALECVDADTP